MDSTIDQRPSFSWSDVEPVAQRFGSFEYVRMLDSERDQNFLLRRLGGCCDGTARGDDEGEDQLVVFKVHNSNDGADVVGLQNLALSEASSAGAACQRLLQTDDGATTVAIDGVAGKSLCRALTFVPGRVLAEAATEIRTDAERARLWAAVGEAMGRVTSALRRLEHAAAHREFVWDLCLCEEVITRRIELVEPSRRPMLEYFLTWYRSDIVPLLPKLRRSIAHNDGNDHNLIVSPTGSIAVLDFGDLVHTYTVADAAICMAYLLLHCPADDPLIESVQPFVRSFHAQCPLEEVEVDALFGLSLMRICTSVCMSAYQSQLEPDNEYLTISAKPAWALLARIADEKAEVRARGILRAACDLESATAAVN